MRGLRLVRGVKVVFCALLALGGWPTLLVAQAGNADRTILVSGATGIQGGAVARELARRGFRVRGLTRDPGSASALALRNAGIEPVQGDFDDPASLDRALNGAYGAFSVQQYRGIGIDAEIRQGKSFADAARRAGIRHFVYTSVAKAPLNTGVPQFDSKLVLEAYLREIGLPYTVVRPASFMVWLQAARREAAAHGVIRGPLPAEQVRNYVAPEDIGRLVAEFFESPTVWLGETIELAGDAVSYAEAAVLLSRHLGRPVRYEQIPWNEYVLAASVTEIARDEWYLEHDVATDVAPLRARFPWLTSVEQYLATLPAAP
jgi:uncharacterized protein YbjT (DUF2867 family)